MLEISRIEVSEIDKVAPLFDAYRVFYKQTSDIAAGTAFLLQRLTSRTAVIFLAEKDGKPVGFTQLYTTYSSVSMATYFILNDLFVIPAFRGQGIGQALLEQAKIHCKQMEYKGLALETAIDNAAQQQYERMGWKKDSEYKHYFWENIKSV
ncbi:MAG: GNAT family N-acetyltransferase [Bacteroidota bacterium]